MRSTLVWLLLASAACHTETRCDGEACAPVCDAIEAELRARVPPGGELLSFEEAKALAPLITEIRHGLRLGPDGFRICHGTSACEAPWEPGRRPTEGDYVVTGRVTVPKFGAWQVDYSKVCTRDGVEVSRGGGPIALTAPAEGDEVDLGILDRFHVRPSPDLAHETTCEYRLASTDGAGFDKRISVVLPPGT